MRTPNRKGPRRTARQAILDAAAAVLSKAPGAPMSDISEAAGVGRATLYRHFPSQEELIKELSLEAIRRTDEATAPVFDNYTTAENALRDMLAALIPLGDLFHFLAGETQAALEPEVADEIQRQLNELASFVEQAKSERLFDDNLPTAWIVAAIDSMVWTAWNSIHTGELAPKAAADLVFRTLVDGMRPR